MWQPLARYLVFRGAGYTRPSSRILRECRSIAWVDTSVSERQSLRHGYRRKAAGSVGADPLQLDDVTPLAERGLSIIPVKFRDKRPATRSWKPFQSRRPTKSQLRGWFDNGGNLNAGIVTGKISGVVVVDLDSPEAIAWADANLPPTAMATKTPRGEHRFFRHPGRPIRNKARVKTGELQLAIDVRADGGYVVAPGSVHETGAVYKRAGTWPPVDKLPVFDPAWLEIDEKREFPKPVPTRRLTDGDWLLHRVRRHLKATPPAIQGEGGDNHTYQVCCGLVRGFDLTDADALELLREWNQRCEPPWSEAELAEKIKGARLYGVEPIGARRDIHLTDSGNAEFFASRYGADLRFDHQRGRWLLWVDHRWQPDTDDEVRRLAKAAMRVRLDHATKIDDPDTRKATVKWALGSESRARLSSLIDLATAERPIADSGDEWDADPMLLCAGNGVVDLRTGSFRAGRRNDRITMATAVPYDPKATCPRWTRFMVEVFNNSTEVVDFVHRAVGYSLTGETDEQCLSLLHGTGSNGKTTMLTTLNRTLGDYVYNMPFSTVEMYQRSSIPNDVAALVGRRFVVASETTDGARINESRIKALTGCDPITARFLHQEFFTFEPVAKFWLAVNHKPVVRDDSHGFWRRIRLIPFTQRFPLNLDLADELQAEREGILAWAVRGCLAWQREGLEPPDVVTEATAEYERESDLLSVFLDEACVLQPDAETRASQLYGHYCAWVDDNQLTKWERLNSTMFGRKMTERFGKVKTGTGHIAYRGIGCRERAL